MFLQFFNFLLRLDLIFGFKQVQTKLTQAFYTIRGVEAYVYVSLKVPEEKDQDHGKY